MWTLFMFSRDWKVKEFYNPTYNNNHTLKTFASVIMCSRLGRLQLLSDEGSLTSDHKSKICNCNLQLPFTEYFTTQQ